jgi:hypothetical protein
MAKNKISEWSATAANNTDIGGIDIAEGCAPSGINNAIRELMAQVKDQQTGTDADNFTVGGNLSVTGTSTFTGGVTIGALSTTGNTTLGDTSGDLLTLTGTAISIPNNLNIDSNTLYVDATNNRVGVGKTNPATALDVTGTVTATAFAGALTGNVTGDLTGNVTGNSTTQSAGTNNTTIATTAFVQAALQIMFPVGCIYTSTVSTNPNTLFGFGTWVAFGAGRVLVGVGGSFTAGATGGSADAVLVSHTHTATSSSSVSDSGHSHVGRVATTLGGSQGYNGFEEGRGNPDWATQTSSDPSTTGISVSTSTSISTEGVSATNANLQPYVVVYIWNRTA